MMRLGCGLAQRFARLAQDNLRQEYPHKLDHVFDSHADVQGARQLHPVFYGSYDWHSSVHMHWLLVHLIGCFPEGAFVPEASALLSSQFTSEAIAGECAYLDRSASRTFERTYGWAWLLALFGATCALAERLPHARNWAHSLEPLARRFRSRYLEFLPLADFAIRTGSHQNSAFGLLLGRTCALQCGDPELLQALDDKARSWYRHDRQYPARYEPQGNDFLSAGLIEAALMQAVLGEQFPTWWHDFAPDQEGIERWTTVVAVSDRSDAQLAHLDGLNLSRAWCLKRIARSLDAEHAALFLSGAEAQIAAAMPHVAAGAFVGTHWLASFAALALSAPESRP